MAYNWKDGVLDGKAIVENSDSPLATLTAVDGEVEAFSYSLSGGHRGLFEIDEHGVLSLKNALDYESSSSNRGRFPSDGIFTVNVRAHADDGKNVNGADVLERSFVLTLQNENDFDTKWRDGRGYNSSGRNLNENNDAGYQVAQFRATDGDRVDIDYSLTGTDAALFSIEERDGGVARLYLKDSLDYDDSHGALYSVIVNANSDDDGTAVSQLYVLTLIDRDDANWQTNGNPSGATVVESAGIGTALVDFDATADAGNGTVTYGIRGRHRDDRYFQIDKETGELTTKREFTDENKDHYTVVVRARADDGGDRIEQTFILTVSEENDFETKWRNGRGYNSSGRNLDENNDAGYRVAQFRATDGDRVDIDYSLTGTDAALFSIEERDGGVARLYLKDSLDYDDGHVAFYSVIVNANSDDDSAAISRLYVLTLNDRNDNDTTWETNGNPSGATLSENLGVDVSIADFGAADGDASATVTYGLRGRHRDDSYFQIDKDTGVLSLKKEFTSETKEHYTVVVRAQADDGGNRLEQTFILTVTEENDFDTKWRNGRGYNSSGRNLDENNDAGYRVAQFRATDGDRVDIDYSLTGTDAALFNIEERDGGVARLYLKDSLDYDDSHVAFYSVIVNANSDDDGTAVSRLYVLTLINREDANWQTDGNHTGATVAESAGIGTALANFDATADNDDATVTYGLRGRHRDDRYFQIDKETGELTTKREFTDENKDHYTVVVRARADDGGSRIEQTFILTIAEENDFETKWRNGRGYNSSGRNLDENNDAGYRVAQFRATDGDRVDIDYSLTGTDAALFSIEERDGGVARLYLKDSLDFDDGHVAFYSVIVNANSDDDSTAISRLYVLTLNDRNEKTEWDTNGNPSGATASENTSGNVALETFKAVDEDITADSATITYGLRTDRSGRDYKYFDIDSTTGVISTDSTFDFESRERYTVFVRAGETGESSSYSVQQTFILTIVDANDSPEWVRQNQPLNRRSETPDGEQNVTIDEAIDGSTSNAVAGRQVAKYKAIDPDSENNPAVQITYSTTGDDAAYFSIDSNGRLFLTSNLDYEDTNHTAKIYSVIIIARSTDDAPSAISNLFVLTLTDREESARWTTEPTGATLAENNTINDPVFTLNAIDGDGDGVTYGIRSRHRDDKYFAIDKDSGELTVKSIFDFENREHYTVVVRARSDEGSGRSTDEQTFILTIADVAETIWETNSNPAGNAIDENNTIGTSLADFGASDVDGTATITYSLSGNDTAYFNINATTGVLTANSVFDFEDTNHGTIYSVVVNANSTDGSTIAQTFILTINDVDGPPAWDVSPDWYMRPDNGRDMYENQTASTEWDGVVFFRSETYGSYGSGDITYGLSGDAASYFYIAAWDSGVSRRSRYYGLHFNSGFDYESEYGQSVNNRYSVVIIANAIEEDNPLTRLYILTINDVVSEVSPNWSIRPNDGAKIDENQTPDSLGELFRAVTDNFENITYGLSGKDADLFNIADWDGSGRYYELHFNSAFDYESDYGQANGNRYSVVITANSSESDITLTQLFVLTINDVDESQAASVTWASNFAPFDGRDIYENQSPDSFRGLDIFLAETDGSGNITYGLSGKDADLFNIADSGSGIYFLHFNSAFDYESEYGQANGNRYSVVITANSTADDIALTQLFVLTINDDVRDNQPPTTPPITWTDAPFYGVDIYENETPDSRGYLDYFYAETSGSGNITYGVSGKDADLFNIAANDGLGGYNLYFNSAFDYESTYGQANDNRYSVVITANSTAEDNALTTLFVLTINDDVSDNPPSVTWNIAPPNGGDIYENETPTSRGYPLDFFLAETNGSGDITYGLSGTDADFFNIAANSGSDGYNLHFNSAFDYESDYGQSVNNRYSIVIIANSTADDIAPLTQLFILTINDVGGSPTWDITPNGGTEIYENLTPDSFGDLDYFYAEADGSANITYGLSGTDASYFNIAADDVSKNYELHFNSAFDYESTYGQSVNNRYSVVITANSTQSDNALTELFVLTINDVEETLTWFYAPVGRNIDENDKPDEIPLNYFLAETNGLGDIIYRISGKDVDYFSLAAAARGRYFLHFKSAFDYESDYGQSVNNRYSIVISAHSTEDNLSLTKLFVLTINDANEFTTRWVDNGNPSGVKVSENTSGILALETFKAVDDDIADTDAAKITYGLSYDREYIYFDIDKDNGVISTDSTFDYESNYGRSINNRYSVIVRAGETGESSSYRAEQTFILTIDNVAEPTVWENNGNPSGATFAENNTIGISLADFNATDGDTVGVAYSLRRNHRDDDYFVIDSATGVLTANSIFDFENKEHYTVEVRANSTDRSASINETFVLTITDVEESQTGPITWVDAPYDGTDIDENEIPDSREGEGIACFLAETDGSANITYGLSGTDASYFYIADSVYGRNELYFKSAFDYESDYGQSINNRYSVVIIANSTEEGIALTQLFVLTINDVVSGDWLTWSYSTPGSGDAIDENLTPDSSGRLILFRAHADGSENITYGLSGDGASYFNIAPTNDDYFDDYFGIAYELHFNSAFDYESDYGQANDNRYSVVIIAHSTEGDNTSTKLFVLTINDVDESQAPTAPTGPITWFNPPYFSGASIDENLTPDDHVYRLDSVSAEISGSGMIITYGLSGKDASYFNLSTRNSNNPYGNYNLHFNSAFDYESDYGQSINNRYSVVIVANSTEEDNALTHLFVLTINDVVDESQTGPITWDYGPSDGTDIDENETPANRDTIAYFLAETDDPSENITYGVSGKDASYFYIVPYNFYGDYELWFKSAFDYESTYGQANDNRYSIVIIANSTEDDNALTQLFVLTINDLYDSTIWENNGNPAGNTIDENNTIGTSIADFGATDIDGATITYGLTGHPRYVSYFNIDKDSGVLSAKSEFNFERTSRYTVTVVASPPDDGYVASQLFVLTINDVEEKLWIYEPSDGADIDENQTPASREEVDYFCAKTDGAGMITYGVSGDAASYFYIAADYRDGRDELYFKSAFDYESDYGQSVNNRYSIVITANSTEDDSALSELFILTINDVVDESQTPTAPTTSTGSITWVSDLAPSDGADIDENQITDRFGALDFFLAKIDGSSDNITYGLSGTDASYFNIAYDDIFGDYVLRSNSAFDYESDYGQSVNNRYSIVITANSTEDDSALSELFILTINDAVSGGGPLTWDKEPPDGVSIDENITPASLGYLWNFYVDADGFGDNITYGLSGDAASYFNLADSYYHPRLNFNSAFDYESAYGQSVNNHYSVVITANSTESDKVITHLFVLTINDVDESGGLAPDPTTPDQPVGVNGKILFDGDTDNLGGISDGIGNDGLAIIGDNLSATQYDSVSATNTVLVLNNIENFADSFVGYTDADGNEQNHWFFVRDDAGDNTGHIVFDADGLDVNLDSLSQGGATTTPDQINLLAGLNFGNDGDFNKPDDLDLNLNGNQAASLTHDQFLALIGGSNNIDFI